jgi:hypothetical protein
MAQHKLFMDSGHHTAVRLRRLVAGTRITGKVFMQGQPVYTEVFQNKYKPFKEIAARVRKRMDKHDLLI